MRYWIYCEPASEVSSVPVYTILSDQAILDSYWEYWCGRMESVGKQAELDRETCIQDWVTIHWAQPADSETLLEILTAPKAE